MIAFLTIMSIVLFAALIMCIRVLMRYARIIIELEDALSEALDVCDSAYGHVVGVLELPIAVNTPEAQHVVRQMANVRDSILYVSNVLAAPYGGITEEVDDAKDS